MRNLGQAFQIGDRLYLVTERPTHCNLSQVCASESLNREGSFKLLGAIPVEWAESDILHLIAEHDQRRD